MHTKYNSDKPRGKDGRFIKVRKSKKKSTKKKSTKKKSIKKKSKRCKYGKRQDGYCKTVKSSKKKKTSKTRCKNGTRRQDGYCKPKKSTKKTTKRVRQPTFNALLTGYIKDSKCKKYKHVEGCQSDPNCRVKQNKCVAKTNVKEGHAVYEGPSFNY